MSIRRAMGTSVIGVALLFCSLSVFAQPAPAGWPPPKVLQIYREEIKPGKSAAHEQVEAGWPKAFAKANWPTNYLAMTSSTGPSEAWFMTGFESLEAWEKDSGNVAKNSALKKELDQLEVHDGELRSGGRSVVALYREDLSHQANVDMPKMRYFRIITFRVRQGHDSQFADAVKIVRTAFEKANVPAHWAVYQIYAGMPGPTFLVILPAKSLAEVDAAIAAAPAVQKEEGEDGIKKLQTIASDAFNSVETNIFEFNAKMSYPSKKWADGDPDYWRPKAGPAAKSEPKKPAGKAEKKSGNS
jgi:hypothetical protein